MTTSVQVNAGVCGFCTTAEVCSEDGQFVTFSVSSDCEKIGTLAEKLQLLGPIDAYTEIKPGGPGRIASTVQETLVGCCAGCAVPTGLFKGMQVEAGLALPQQISISIAKT